MKSIFRNFCFALLFILTGNALAQCNFTVVVSSDTICSGKTVTLSASGTTSYTWSTGSFNDTIIESPNVTTQYVVAGSDGTCTTTQTIDIVVNPTPTVAASASSPTTCSGNSVVLSGTSNVSGTGSGYLWMPGSSGSPSITLNPIATTVYSLYAFNSTCTGSTTVLVSVYALPSVSLTASDPTVCSGTHLTLTPSGASGYTLLPNTTGTQFSVFPTSTTIYTVIGENAAGCRANGYETVTVISSPTMVVGITPTFVCYGQTTTLSSSGADFYYWSPINMSGATVVVSPTLTQTYTLTGYNNNGCTGTTTIPMNVNPVPTINISNSSPTICSGATVSLTATGATNYTWLPPNTSGSSFVASPTVSTVYVIYGTYTNSCIQTATTSIGVAANPVVSVTGPSTICANTTVTLIASGAQSYTWQPGTVIAPQIVVTPTSTATFSAVGSNSSGCTASALKTITVTQNPSVIAATSDANICYGDTLTLSANGAQSFTWQPVNTIAPAITIIPTSSTIYTVTGEQDGCTAIDTIAITVAPLPTVAITGDFDVCAGNSTSLIASGASFYNWLPVNMTGQVIFTQINTTTQFTVTGTDSSGCKSSAIVTVTASPNPQLIASVSPTPTCGQQNYTLSASGANTFTWQPGSLGGATVVVSPGQDQVYTVSGNIGDCANSTAVTVTVLDVPSLTISTSAQTICVGESATLTVAGASTYTWGDGSTTNTSVVTPPISYSFAVTGVSDDGCPATLAFFQEVSECTGIVSIESRNEVLLYPNPNNGNFTIQLNEYSVDLEVALYDALGRRVYIQSLSGSTALIETTGLVKGLYTVVVSGEGFRFVTKTLLH